MFHYILLTFTEFTIMFVCWLEYTQNSHAVHMIPLSYANNYYDQSCKVPRMGQLKHATTHFYFSCSSLSLSLSLA